MQYFIINVIKELSVTNLRVAMPAIDAPKTRLAPNFSDRRPPGTKSIENTNAQFYFQSIENTN